MKFLAILIILVGLNCFALSFSSSQQLKKTAGSSAKKVKNHSGQNTICGCCAGKNGLNGRDGRDGLSGRDGIKGDKGGQGERGYNGTCNEGDKGKKGAQGIQGVKGAQGEQGYNGTCDKSAMDTAVKQLENIITSLELKIQALENATAVPECPLVKALGMENGGIRNNQLTASSTYKNNDNRYGAHRARMKFVNGWAAGTLDTRQYLQIELSRYTNVTAVETQGYGWAEEWVRTYQISYSLDKTNWSFYTENNAIKTFSGNSDSHTRVKHTLRRPIQRTLLMRFLPKTWHSHISMRVEVYGCYE